jgi:hypothetical protein
MHVRSGEPLGATAIVGYVVRAMVALKLVVQNH